MLLERWKQVGKVSMEWKAIDSTQVVGTYPPVNKKKWTGYVEKDTAGQTNIYAVEPTVYVSDNVISSNSAGDSTEGSQQTVLVTVGLAMSLLLGAALVLRSLSNSSPPDTESLPNLSFYIQKFTPLLAPSPSSAPPLEASQISPVQQPSAEAEEPPIATSADTSALEGS
ncbi:hypothetical protein KP509_04G010600 [Ceratopteris richardii]|uniref:Uncharacterized protein n=1 Tax=Ceratopteris richardii TaxID=49495 RepID=A0A8T2UUB3_CERRI|nr:hypothetical protein KP509_04G010600 [Ceratopteris richardii]